MKTDLNLDGTVDVSELGPAGAEIVSRVVSEVHRIGIVRDGIVVAVIIDHDDARNFEHLELDAEEKWLRRSQEEEPDDGVRIPMEEVHREQGD